MLNIHITERQWDVLRLLRMGYNYTEISQKLFITYGTVVGHACLMRKAANVKTNAELVEVAERILMWEGTNV